MSQYYIDISGSKDGPHDLVTIMRRIRANKIMPETLIYAGNATIAVQAAQLEDTALFFTHSTPQNTNSHQKKETIPSLRLRNIIKEAWSFTANNSIITVFSGSILLICIVSAIYLASIIDTALSAMLCFIIYNMLQYIYLVCILRIYRGQPFSEAFWNTQFPIILPKLLLAGLVIGLMMVGSLILCIVPYLIISVWYAFVPFLIQDRKMSLIEAMTASRLLLRKHRNQYQWNLALIVTMHLLSLILIFPAPIVLPIFSAALARFYEELSSS